MPFTAGQYLTANDLKSQEDAHTLGYGVVNGLKVIPEAPPSMDIEVEIGKAYAADTLVVKGAVTTLTVGGADPTNPRKDIVVCNSAGTLSIVAGTPEAALPGANVGVYTLNPEPPDIPANSIILAEIWVAAGAASITGAEIYDKRVSIADFLTHKDAATGVHGVGVSTVESVSGSQAKVDAHKDLATGVHGVGVGTVAKKGDIAVDANLSAAAQDAVAKRHTQNTDTDLSPAHKDAATGVHGVGAGTVAKKGDIAVDANLSAAAQDAITKRHARSHDHSNALDGSPIAEAGVPNHMSKNKLAFTANKLLKGAGAGSDPTEIDVPSAKSIVTGFYTGDDNDDRQITVGFKCSLVIIQADSIKKVLYITNNTALGFASESGTIDEIAVKVLLHASDGFVVDKLYANYSGSTYYYWAISE